MLKLIKDYDLDNKYHPKKVYVVVDALSRKIPNSVNWLITRQK